MDEVRNSVLFVGTSRADFPDHVGLMSLLDRFIRPNEVVPETLLALSPPVDGSMDAIKQSHLALFDFGLTEHLGGWWMIPAMLHVFLGPDVTLSQVVHLGCRIGDKSKCTVWEQVDGVWNGTELTGSGDPFQHPFEFRAVDSGSTGSDNPSQRSLTIRVVEPSGDAVTRLGHTFHSAATWFWGPVRRTQCTQVHLELWTGQSFALALGRNRIQADPEIHMDGIRFN